MRKPYDIPISMLSRLKEKDIPSAPALANTLLKANEMTQAKNKPKAPPRTAADDDVIVPSINANALISERLRPTARMIASSALLLSASIITIVRTRRIPAPMVNAPKTKNIADSTPAPSWAEANAFSLAGMILRFIDSTPEISSSHDSTAEKFPSLITKILLSPSDAEANVSPSVRLTNPIIIDSSSSRPGASSDDMFPSISNSSGNVSP